MKGPHNWERLTLVGTHYDYRCLACGKRANGRHCMHGPPAGAQCPAADEIAPTDCPLGWWAGQEHNCSACGGASELVPRTGHPLSGLWVHERLDGMQLYACTSGCMEKS